MSSFGNKPVKLECLSNPKNFRFSSLQGEDDARGVCQSDIDENLDVLKLMRMGLEKKGSLGRFLMFFFLLSNCNYKLFLGIYEVFGEVLIFLDSDTNILSSAVHRDKPNKPIGPDNNTRTNDQNNNKHKSLWCSSLTRQLPAKPEEHKFNWASSTKRQQILGKYSSSGGGGLR